MNEFDFYTKVYGFLHNYSGIPTFVFTPLRRIVRGISTKRLPKYFAKHPANINRTQKHDVIVSLTSFPARIGYVYMTIESLLRQSVLPERILLWLSKEQFPSETMVPNRLKSLQNEVFQIRYVDGDIRSHKKYYYSIREYPEKIVITTDDDIIYPADLVEGLLAFSDKYQGCIIANIAKTLTFTNGVLDGYKKWTWSKPDDVNNNVQIGAGGVLYPPHCLYDDLLNLELSQKLAPTVDDLWLNTMARIKGTTVIKTNNRKLFLPIVIKENQSLTSVNNGENKNDEQLNQIREYYSQTSMGDPYCSL